MKVQMGIPPLPQQDIQNPPKMTPRRAIRCYLFSPVKHKIKSRLNLYPHAVSLQLAGLTEKVFGQSVQLVKKCLIGFLITILSIFVFSSLVQTQPSSSVALTFDVSYSRFRTASELVYLEIYYSVSRHQLQFVQDGDQFGAMFKIKTEIYQNGLLTLADSTINVTYTDSLSKITQSQKLINLSKFAMQQGDYKVDMIVTDLNSKRNGKQTLILSIQSFPKDTLSISDIQLATTLRVNREEPDKFTKNHYQVIPNPGAMYGFESPMLYFYVEIYNLMPQAENNQYRISSSIHNLNGDKIRTIQEKVKEKPGTSSVETIGFNIISLRTNTYVLQFEVEDLATGNKIEQTKKFFVYREGDFQPQGLADKSNPEMLLNSFEYKGYDQLDVTELDAEFESAKYLATPEEVTIYKGLDLQGKRDFLKSFWLKRDTDLTTIQNEFRRQYLNNLKYVNLNYGTGKPGWKSDLGRIYLLYGKPDEVERFPSTFEARSYEIWNYFNIQAGINFIFIDIRGYGEYVLVHSSARNELYDIDWQRWLSIR